ncbi:MAG TPA: HIT domain-containing protein [Candidatus Krumholzibacteria bacterium]|nr:HIT domain-containing protein [Candidatus Krumholzibacteria bacterium]
MRRLWAPWRAKYVEGAAGAGTEPCFLCAYGADTPEALTHVLWRWRHWYATLNAYPYTNGHLMLALVRHHEGFIGLEAGETAELPTALAACEAALRRVYQPHGMNIGVNVGRAAGAGAVGHLHVHFLPRWNGDTNFMTTIAETRVVPEGLEVSHARLRAAFTQGAS